jgi:hypothetical protein
VNAVERKGRGFKRRLCCGPARADKAAALSFKGNESPVDFVFPHQLFAEVNDFILDEFPAQLFFFRTQEPHNRLIPFPAPGAAQFWTPSAVRSDQPPARTGRCGTTRHGYSIIVTAHMSEIATPPMMRCTEDITDGGAGSTNPTLQWQLRPGQPAIIQPLCLCAE